MVKTADFHCDGIKIVLLHHRKLFYETIKVTYVVIRSNGKINSSIELQQYNNVSIKFNVPPPIPKYFITFLNVSEHIENISHTTGLYRSGSV